MRRISILVLFVWIFMATAASAQQSPNPLHFGKGPIFRHHLPQRMSGMAAIQGRSSPQSGPGHQANIWELGTYPGGTWSALGDINDFGVAVGMGDVPPIDPESGTGVTHALAVSLFGPHAGEWVDLGTLGGAPMGEEEPLNRISDTGVVVGYSVTTDGHKHGIVWTKKSGLVDLGTLADVGYSDYDTSKAWGTNKLGTLIVGTSGVGCPVCIPSSPVVWTPSPVWKDGQWTTQWKIHKLDTTGFPDLAHWYTWGVNDFGQIIAFATNADETAGVPILWSPSANGKGWKITVLPPSPDFAFTCPYNINDKGEISGVVQSEDWSTWLPVFWKPSNKTRKSYSQPIALALPDGFIGGYADGINEFGDMTGELWGEAGDQAFRWSTKDPNFVETLGFPGDVSWSWGVSNARIAVVTYGGANCTAASCGGAIQIH